jgi:hypothetical protein
MAFPTELVREVVGHLSRIDDASTLQAASLASPTFRTLCQEKIFFEINIYKEWLGIDDGDHHIAGLEILRRNNTLVSFIKALSVKMDKGEPVFPKDESMQSSMVELLQMVVAAHVENFSFAGWKGQMTLEFQRCIAAFIGSTWLTSLTLIHAPGELLKLVNRAHLRHLTLVMEDSVHFGDPTQTSQEASLSLSLSNPARNRVKPISFKVTPSAPAISLLKQIPSVVDLSAVRELTLLGASVRLQADAAIFIACQCTPSLKILRMPNGFCEPMSCIIMDAFVNGALVLDSAANSLHGLEGLEQLIVYRPDLWGFDHPAFIRAGLNFFLDALPSPNSLSHIEVEDFFEASLVFISLHCTHLASALADRARFPRFQELKLKSTRVGEEWEAALDNCWRVLRNVGVKVEVPGHQRNISYVPS